MAQVAERGQRRQQVLRAIGQAAEALDERGAVRDRGRRTTDRTGADRVAIDDDVAVVVAASVVGVVACCDDGRSRMLEPLAQRSTSTTRRQAGLKPPGELGVARLGDVPQRERVDAVAGHALRRYAAQHATILHRGIYTRISLIEAAPAVLESVDDDDNVVAVVSGRPWPLLAGQAGGGGVVVTADDVSRCGIQIADHLERRSTAGLVVVARRPAIRLRRYRRRSAQPATRSPVPDEKVDLELLR